MENQNSEATAPPLKTIYNLANKRRILATKVNQYQRDMQRLAYLVHKEHSQLKARAYCAEETCTFIREVQKKNEKEDE